MVPTSKDGQEISVRKFLIVMTQMQGPYKTEPSRKAQDVPFIKNGFKGKSLVFRKRRRKIA